LDGPADESVKGEIDETLEYLNGLEPFDKNLDQFLKDLTECEDMLKE